MKHTKTVFVTLPAVILFLISVLILLTQTSQAADDNKIEYISKITLDYEPGDLVIDNQNNIFIADLKNGRIQKYDSNGKALTGWSVGSVGRFGLATDGQSIFTKTKDAIVQKFDQTGNLISKIKLGDGSSKGLSLAVDVKGTIFTSRDSGFDSLTVEKFDNQGKLITSWDLPVSDDATIARADLMSVGRFAIDSQGDLYIVLAAARSSSFILHYDLNGRLLERWDTGAAVLGLGTDRQNNIYTSLYFGSACRFFGGGVKYTSNGAKLVEWATYNGSCDSPNIKDGVIIAPSGIAVNSQGMIYVSDKPSGNTSARLQIFRQPNYQANNQTSNNITPSSTNLISGHYPGKLVYNDKDNNIFLINPDGSGRKKVTKGVTPIFSPDGKRVAFVDPQGKALGDPGDSQQKATIVSTNLDGADRQILCVADRPNYLISLLTWSPRNRFIALTGVPTNIDLGGIISVYLCSITDKKIGSQSLSGNLFDWSPDGENAVWLSSTSNNTFDVFYGDPDKPNVGAIKLTTGQNSFEAGITGASNFVYSEAHFSPDGKTIAIVGSKIFFVSVPGQKSPLEGKVIDPSPDNYILSVAWSPDSQALAYIEGNYGGQNQNATASLKIVELSNGQIGKTVTLVSNSELSPGSSLDWGGSEYNYELANPTATSTISSISSPTPIPTTPSASVSNLPPLVKMMFSRQPVGGYANALLSTQPIVIAYDNNGNPSKGFNGRIAVSIKYPTGNSGATLGGTLVVNAIEGVATFTDLIIDLPGSAYVLTANLPDFPQTPITIDSQPFSLNGPTKPLPGISGLEEWDTDDLFHKAQSANWSTDGLNVKVNINRYYGSVLAGGKLIDNDCSDPCTAPEDKARNRKLHDTIAVLNLWMEDLDTSQINLTGVQASVNTGPLNSPDYFSVKVSVPGFKTKQSGMVKIYIPVSKLYFPDACRTGNQSCLRDPNNANYDWSEKEQKNIAPDRSETFHTLQPALNAITIKGLTIGNKPLNVKTSYLFLNGLRPVMLMAGIDFPTFDDYEKDTTNDWGGLGPNPTSSDPSDRCKELGDKAKKDATYFCKENNWIKWLSKDVGVPTWNPSRNGTRSIEDQQSYLKQGAAFLNRIYGAKKINIIAHSMGGVTSRRFIYESWKKINGNDGSVTVDKLVTFDSPHTGVTAAYASGNFLGSPVAGAAQADLGTYQMQDFNRDNDLREAWGKDYNAAKKHIFFTTVHAKDYPLCLINNFNVACLGDANFIQDDGAVEDKSATGTEYSHWFNVDKSHLPGDYSNYPDPLPDICNHVKLDQGDFFCHGWVLGSSEIKKWVEGTVGVFDYCRNNLPNYFLALYTACDPGSLTLFNKTGLFSDQKYLFAYAGQGITATSTISSTPNTLLYLTGSITSSSTITVPITIDKVEDLFIRVSTDSNNQPVQVRLESADKTQATPDKLLPL
jgi:hypothetical protein